MLYSSSFTIVAASATPSTTQAGGGGSNEIQNIALIGNTGSFTITYSGQTTSAITVPPTEADVIAKLEALSNIGTGDVDVTVTTNAANDYDIDIEFQGALADTNVAQVTTTVTNLYNSTLIAEGRGDSEKEGCVFLSTEDSIAIGGQEDNATFPLPDASVSGPFEVDLYVGETLYANGAGTVHLLETALDRTPDL